MIHNSDSFSKIHSDLINQVSSNSELMLYREYSMMVNDLLQSEHNYGVYPKVGKYSKIFRYVNIK